MVFFDGRSDELQGTCDELRNAPVGGLLVSCFLELVAFGDVRLRDGFEFLKTSWIFFL